MERSSIIFGTCLLIVAAAMADDRPKVVVVDVQSWERAHDVGQAFDELARFNWTKTWGCPRAKEILSTFKDQCQKVLWIANLQDADYVLVFDSHSENEVAAFTATGHNLVVKKSTPSLSESIQQACDGVAEDWVSNRDTIRADTAAKEAGRKAENADATAIGSVTGVVVDEKGHPVIDAIAYVWRMGGRYAMQPEYTGSGGHFSASRLDWGTYYIVAEKQAAGYAMGDPYDWSVFELSPENPHATVTVQLGEKAGVLLLSVIDGVSREPVEHAYVQLSCDCPPETRQTFVAQRFDPGSREKILVPPNREYTLVVGAPGYERWTYPTAAGHLRLEPEQQLTLEVPLKRQPASPIK